jgi:hypothetical protein
MLSHAPVFSSFHLMSRFLAHYTILNVEKNESIRAQMQKIVLAQNTQELARNTGDRWQLIQVETNEQGEEWLKAKATPSLVVTSTSSLPRNKSALILAANRKNIPIFVLSDTPNIARHILKGQFTLVEQVKLRAKFNTWLFNKEQLTPRSEGWLSKVITACAPFLKQQDMMRPSD